MNEILLILQETYTCLSKIPASGDAVDFLAVARQNIRKLLNNLREEAQNGEQKSIAAPGCDNDR